MSCQLIITRLTRIMTYICQFYTNIRTSFYDLSRQSLKFFRQLGPAFLFFVHTHLHGCVFVDKFHVCSTFWRTEFLVEFLQSVFHRLYLCLRFLHEFFYLAYFLLLLLVLGIAFLSLRLLGIVCLFADSALAVLAANVPDVLSALMSSALCALR